MFLAWVAESWNWARYLSKSGNASPYSKEVKEMYRYIRRVGLSVLYVEREKVMIAIHVYAWVVGSSVYWKILKSIN